MRKTVKTTVPRSAVRRSLADGQFRTRIQPAKPVRRASGYNRTDARRWGYDD